MTRASLLHILDHVNGISEAEIRELEQLAAAFPYCQTAHILLAKAAHDRGSMLASQRLRRAATYAADRELLRQLIELPAPVISAAGFAAPAAAEQEIPATAEEEAPEYEEVHDEAAAEQEAPAAALESWQASATVEPAYNQAVEQPLTAVKEVMAPYAEPSTAEVPASSTTPTEDYAPALADQAESAPTTAEPAGDELTASSDEQETPEAIQEPAAAPEPNAEAQPAEAPAPLESPDEEIAAVAAVDDVLPAVAPPIRPPVEVGAARFEFGLAATEPEITPVYQLPTLDEEEPTPSPAAAQVPAFRTDADLAYALGGGSRLGFCLQLRDEFTQDLPAESFFAPDALLLAHLKAHTPPPAPPSRSSFELINKFLRAQPRLKTPTLTAPPADEQADLSVRSTQVVPELASESLAKIMVRQGKIAKAIEIYERLIVRQPEKKAYFADQIQQLKSTE